MLYGSGFGGRTGSFGLRADCFERVFFVAHRLEAQKLAVGSRCRHDFAAEEDIRPFCRVHTDFKSFSKQNIAGEQVRIHSQYVRYLLQGQLHACAVLAFNRDMDARKADVMELSLRHVDFNRSIKGCEVDQDILTCPSRGSMCRISAFAAAVPANMGVSRRLHCLCRRVEGHSGFSRKRMPWLCSSNADTWSNMSIRRGLACCIEDLIYSPWNYRLCDGALCG